MAEVELKFEVPAKSQAAFRRLEPLAAVKPKTARLHAIYFDTPDFELRKREMSLRLRRTGRRWVQGLKAGRSGAGGLHAREEWEVARPDASLDLAAFEQMPVLGSPLNEVFAVDVTRTTWTLEPSPGNLVEVALDRGAVTREGGEEQVSEVEIESLAGDPAAIFELAEKLLALAPMRPSTVTKAQRGYRLALGEAAGPVKARPVALDASMSVPAAARAVVGAALEQLQANDAGVLAGEDPEYLHQARVALRRLRSALRVFRGTFDPGFLEQALAELSWLARLTGPARDRDVLATQTLPPLAEAWGAKLPRSALARLAARRREAGEALREALASPRYARFVLLVARELGAPLPAAADQDLTTFARRVLRKGARRLLEDATRLSALTPAERHRLRLKAKRVRYAAEALAPLFRRKRIRRFIDALSDLQEDLGRANDAAVAERLLAEASLPAGPAQFARGWLAGRLQASSADLDRHGERLAGVCDLR